jgi:hypothetical protein
MRQNSRRMTSDLPTPPTAPPTDATRSGGWPCGASPFPFDLEDNEGRVLNVRLILLFPLGWCLVAAVGLAGWRVAASLAPLLP